MNNINFSSLDASLLSYVNSEQRWEEFKSQLIRPLTVTKYSPITGNVLYQGYPIDGNSLDFILMDSTFLGRSKHLLLISLIYHMNRVTSQPITSPYLDVASHFTTHNYYQHFSSLIKHIINANAPDDTNARDNLLSLIRIWDPRIGDYVNAYSLKYDFMIDCQLDDSRLYNWQINDGKASTSMDDNGSSTWSQCFTPLRYYNWMIPGSKLSKLDFYLDPNTSYMYSWLQDYLAKCRLYRMKISELAKAVKTRDAYKKKRDKASRTFVERNARLSSKIRANIGRIAIHDPSERQRERIQRQFLQQLSALYGKFLRQINTISKK